MARTTIKDITSISPEELNNLNTDEVDRLLREGGRIANAALARTLKAIPEGERPIWLQDPEKASRYRAKSWLSKPWDNWDEKTKLGVKKSRLRELQKFLASSKRSKGGLEKERREFRKTFSKAAKAYNENLGQAKTDEAEGKKQKSGSRIRVRSYINTPEGQKKFWEVYSRLTELYPDLSSDSVRGGSSELMRAINDVWDTDTMDIDSIFSRAKERLDNEYQRSVSKEPSVGRDDISDFFE